MIPTAPTLALPPGLPESRARRRLLAVAILFTVLATIGLGIVAPAVEAVTEARDHAERQQALLSRLTALQRQAPAFRRDLAALDAELSAPEMVLRAPSPSQAAAQLAATVRAVLEAEGVPIDSAQALPGTPQGALLRVGLRFEFRTAIEPFHRIVQRIEAHRPNLVVRDALVAARIEAAAGTPELLSVRMDVLALAQVANAS